MNVVVDNVAGDDQIEARHMNSRRRIRIAVAHFDEPNLLALEIKDAIVYGFGKALRPFDLVGEVLIQRGLMACALRCVTTSVVATALASGNRRSNVGSPKA